VQLYLGLGTMGPNRKWERHIEVVCSDFHIWRVLDKAQSHKVTDKSLFLSIHITV